SPLSGLYAGPCLGPNASAAHERFRAFAAVPSRHVALIDPGESAGCTRPVPSPATLAFVRWRRTRHSQVPTIRVRWAAFSRLSWFAPLRPVGWLASLDGSDQTRVWPPETCTTGLPTGRSPFPPPAMTTVATGQAPPAGLAPAGTSVSIAAPPTPQMGPYHRSSLLDHHEGVAGVDGLPHLDADLPDTARHRRPELVLHLHRLEHDEPVPGMHRLPDLDLDVHDLARHRRLEHLATRHGLAAAGADDVPGLLLDADMIALAVHLDDGGAVLVAHVDHVRHAADQERPDALRRLPAVDLADRVADGDAVPAVRSG